MSIGLPDIEQEFVADVTRWLAGIEAMIQAGREFIDNCMEEAGAVEGLQAEIDHLDGKEVTVGVLGTSAGIAQVEELKLELDTLHSQIVNVYTHVTGDDTGDAAESLAALAREYESLDGEAELFRSNMEGIALVDRAVADGNRDAAEAFTFVGNEAQQAGADLGAFREAYGGVAKDSDAYADFMASQAAYFRSLGMDVSDAGNEMGGFSDALETSLAATSNSVTALGSLRDATADANQATAASVAVTGAKADKLAALQKAIAEVGLSEEELARLSAASGDAIFSQGEAAKTKADKIRDLQAIYDVLTSTEESTLWIPRDMAEAMGAVAPEIDQVGEAAQQAERRIRLLGTGFTVTGYQLHWLIAGSSEFLAVFVPAMIAAGAAAGVMLEGVGWVADRLKATFYATEATAATLGTTTGNLFGLKDSLQQAQTAADPQIWELLGVAVNACKESFGTFWEQGGEVVHMLDVFGASLDMSLGPGGVLGGQAQDAVKDMVNDLRLFGEILGNVGHIILSLATDMPGLAEVIFTIIADLTGLLNDLLKFKDVGYFVTLLMAMEELGRWGGLLLRVFAPMVTAIGGLMGRMGELILTTTGLDDVIGAENVELTALGTAAEAASIGLLDAGAATEALGAEMAEAGAMTRTLRGTFLMLFTTPIGWILLATAGLIALAYEMHLLSGYATQTDQAIAKMQETLGNETPAQGFGTIIAQFQEMNALKDQVTNVASGGFLSQIGDYFKMLVTGTNPVMVAQQSTAKYNSELNSLVLTQASLISSGVKVNGTYYNAYQTMGLASAAGVTMNEMFNKQGQVTSLARQMISNLIAGYQDMGQTGSMLAEDINAIDVQTLAQQTDVSKLNSAWDDFLSTVTGGTSALAGLNSDLLTIGNVTNDATSKISAFGQQADGTNLSVKQIAKSLESFSGTSAQVWTNYNSAVTQAGSVTDWLRTAISEGAISQGQYVDSIKGVVSELLPFAAHSQTAVAELDAIAENAGETTTSYQSLSQWVGNTKQAQGELNNTVNQGTIAMSNLGNVAAELSDTLDSEVDSAIASGSVNIKGITAAAAQFTSQLEKGNVWTGSFTGSVGNLVSQLRNAGEPINDVIAVMNTMATRAGLSATQIGILDNQIRSLNQQLSQVHSVSATVNVEFVASGSSVAQAAVQGGGRYVSPGAHAAASGMRVPGYGGGDTVPAMLEPGEAVVPKHLVGAVAPFLGAHGVPGFAKGGVVESPMEKVIAQWASEMWKDDLRQYGRKGPIGSAEMAKIFGPASFPASGGVWSNPQYRTLSLDERKDMDPYYVKDVAYNKILSEANSLKSGEASQIAAWQSDEKKYGSPSSVTYWSRVYRDDISYAQGKVSEYKAKLAATSDAKLRADYTRDIAKYTAEVSKYQSDLSHENTYYSYSGKIENLKKEDAEKMREFQAELNASLRSMGYAKGGIVPFGHYDQGGYLPVGLSMALNTTGRPEAVGGGGGGDSAPLHVHLEMGGKQIAEAILPNIVSASARYGIRNSGKVTGLLRPS